MNCDATNCLQTFQEFIALAKFWLKDQGINRRDQYHKIVYLLGPNESTDMDNSDSLW